MKVFTSLITNPWTISIITGLIVFFITDFVKKYRRKRDYYRNVELANLEVLKTLKMLIPERELPELTIIKSIHLATARKYEVNIRDVNSLPLILDDLIKEIMDSSFLAYKERDYYCLERKREILKYLGYEDKTQQIALF